MARKPSRPGRALIVFLIGVALLYGLVAIGGNWKPALGLDLQGGTRITLVAKDDPSSSSLEEARKIIDQRVNGSGVSEAEVTTQGSKFIVVEIPGENRRDLVDTVKRQAQLRFRTVACTEGPGGVTGPCAGAAAPTNPTAPAQPDAKSSSKPSSKAPQKPSASPKGRAPFLADQLGQADESASPTPSPSTTVTPSEAPTSEAPSSSEDKAKMALDFMANPSPAAIKAFNEFSCPSNAPVRDDADQFLVTCGTEDDAGTKYLLSPAAVEGTDLSDASAGVPQQQVQWVVSLQLGGEGKQVFADLSRNMVGTEQQFAIVLDGQVISAPTFDGVITNGEAQISGNFNETSAQSLATSLKYGSLPVAFERDVSSEDVGPSLAGNQLDAGLTAGALGLILVMLYCLVYYRGLGLVVLASLITAAAITYAMVLLLANTAGFTLTLPGIAGLIIGVGVTADSFIIFFERIRDEMREGKSMRVAVESGWQRARKTRLAANVVSLLSAAVLYLFATGVVKGFGFALGLSTLIDLAILFWFTKPLVSYLARFRFFNSGGELSGLSAGTLGIDRVAQGGKA